MYPKKNDMGSEIFGMGGKIGDRMWAAYKNKPYAIYGEAK